MSPPLKGEEERESGFPPCEAVHCQFGPPGAMETVVAAMETWVAAMETWVAAMAIVVAAMAIGVAAMAIGVAAMATWVAMVIRVVLASRIQV